MNKITKKILTAFKVITACYLIYIIGRAADRTITMHRQLFENNHGSKDKDSD